MILALGPRAGHGEGGTSRSATTSAPGGVCSSSMVADNSARMVTHDALRCAQDTGHSGDLYAVDLTLGAYGARMRGLLVFLLVVWLVLAVLGFIIKGLFWLAILGIVLFVATGVWGFIRRGAARA